MREERVVKAKDLVDRRGFVREFWRLLRIERRLDQRVSRSEIYDYLNEVYYAEYGVDAYPSFNAFRHSKEFRDQTHEKKEPG